jgi:hypothetical protein
MRHSMRAALAAPLLLATSSVIHAQNPGTTSTAFNPAVSLILNGHYIGYSEDPDGYALPGFLLGAEAGLNPEGFSLDETELAMSANVDDKFYGFMTASMAEEGGETSIGLEEAYFETLVLPHGLTVKAGRFLSDIGYLNPIHSHAWKFADAPLAYRAMLNTSYKDTGVQLRWVAPAPILIEIGGEWLRGDAFPAAGAEASSGRGASSLFVHFGGDVGAANSWRTGVSRLSVDANGRESAFDDALAVFTGSSDLTIVDFVWKWARRGNPRDRSFVAQAEYLHRSESGTVSVANVLPVPLQGGYDGTQDGFYAEGVYQFRPRWRVGLRYDRLDASNDVTGIVATTPLGDTSHSPTRTSVMVDFSNSEFSRLRVQWNRDESRPVVDEQVFVQYLMSLGAHGAHRF